MQEVQAGPDTMLVTETCDGHEEAQPSEGAAPRDAVLASSTSGLLKFEHCNATHEGLVCFSCGAYEAQSCSTYLSRGAWANKSATQQAKLLSADLYDGRVATWCADGVVRIHSPHANGGRVTEVELSGALATSELTLLACVTRRNEAVVAAGRRLYVVGAGRPQQELAAAEVEDAPFAFLSCGQTNFAAATLRTVRVYAADPPAAAGDAASRVELMHEFRVDDDITALAALSSGCQSRVCCATAGEVSFTHFGDDAGGETSEGTNPAVHTVSICGGIHALWSPAGRYCAVVSATAEVVEAYESRAAGAGPGGGGRSAGHSPRSASVLRCFVVRVDGSTEPSAQVVDEATVAVRTDGTDLSTSAVAISFTPDDPSSAPSQCTDGSRLFLHVSTEHGSVSLCLPSPQEPASSSPPGEEAACVQFDRSLVPPNMQGSEPVFSNKAGPSVRSLCARPFSLHLRSGLVLYADGAVAVAQALPQPGKDTPAEWRVAFRVPGDKAWPGFAAAVERRAEITVTDPSRCVFTVRANCVVCVAQGDVHLVISSYTVSVETQGFAWAPAATFRVQECVVVPGVLWADAVGAVDTDDASGRVPAPPPDRTGKPRSFARDLLDEATAANFNDLLAHVCSTGADAPPPHRKPGETHPGTHAASEPAACAVRVHSVWYHPRDAADRNAKLTFFDLHPVVLPSQTETSTQLLQSAARWIRGRLRSAEPSTGVGVLNLVTYRAEIDASRAAGDPFEGFHCFALRSTASNKEGGDGVVCRFPARCLLYAPQRACAVSSDGVLDVTVSFFDPPSASVQSCTFSIPDAKGAFLPAPYQLLPAFAAAYSARRQAFAARQLPGNFAPLSLVPQLAAPPSLHDEIRATVAKATSFLKDGPLSWF
ncbi:hypothetical protein DIPPA_31581 [Diplonema papillatum]|nr:hypothetical protein DIPPA_31581 [Diplonema papillatum]